MIWPRSAILHRQAASIVDGIFELTVSTAARIATFGLLEPERPRQIDRVLADVDLVVERRRDVDRRVGDDQHLVIGRHVHDEDVADAPAGAQPGLARDHRAEQLVGVQAALHQQLRFARAHQRHRFRRGLMAVRGLDDAHRCRASMPAAAATSRIFAAGPTRIGVISFFSPASMAPASAEASQGCATAVGTGSSSAQRFRSCSYFPVPAHVVLAVPVSRSSSVRPMASATP